MSQRRNERMDDVQLLEILMKQKLWWGVFFCSAMLVLQVVQWGLFDWLTPFVMGPINLLLWVALLGCMVWALVDLLRHRKTIGLKRAGLPFGVYVVTMVILYFVPIASFYFKYDFNKNFPVRQAIADHYVTESKNGMGYHEKVIPLPDAEKHLSSGGGDIIVDNQNHAHTTIVFFFTFRGVLDNFAGFMYRSDATYPQPTDIGGDFFEIVPLREHWFYVSSR